MASSLCGFRHFDVVAVLVVVGVLSGLLVVVVLPSQVSRTKIKSPPPPPRSCCWSSDPAATDPADVEVASMLLPTDRVPPLGGSGPGTAHNCLFLLAASSSSTSCRPYWWCSPTAQNSTGVVLKAVRWVFRRASSLSASICSRLRFRCRLLSHPTQVRDPLWVCWLF